MTKLKVALAQYLHIFINVWHYLKHSYVSAGSVVTFVLMLNSILAVAPQWCILCHVSYIGMLVFPDSWNSSCSSLKGLITSLCSSAPLYEIARKAKQAEGQQRQPAYSKARDTMGTISPIPQKVPTCTHVRMSSEHMHAPSHTSTVLILSYTHMPCWRAKKKKLHNGHIMQSLVTLAGNRGQRDSCIVSQNKSVSLGQWECQLLIKHDLYINISKWLGHNLAHKHISTTNIWLHKVV